MAEDGRGGKKDGRGGWKRMGEREGGWKRMEHEGRRGWRKVNGCGGRKFKKQKKGMAENGRRRNGRDGEGKQV